MLYSRLTMTSTPVFFSWLFLTATPASQTICLFTLFVTSLTEVAIRFTAIENFLSSLMQSVFASKAGWCYIKMEVMVMALVYLHVTAISFFNFSSKNVSLYFEIHSVQCRQVCLCLSTPDKSTKFLNEKYALKSLSEPL